MDIVGTKGGNLKSEGYLRFFYAQSLTKVLKVVIFSAICKGLHSTI